MKGRGRLQRSPLHAGPGSGGPTGKDLGSSSALAAVPSHPWWVWALLRE